MSANHNVREPAQGPPLRLAYMGCERKVQKVRRIRAEILAETWAQGPNAGALPGPFPAILDHQNRLRHLKLDFVGGDAGVNSCV